DPQKARQRDENLRKTLGQAAPASASDLIPPLAAGVVDADGKDNGAGARFIQPRVDAGGRTQMLDDITGGGFVLLMLPALSLAGEAKSDWEAIGGRSLTIGTDFSDNGALESWLKQHNATAVIVRPDFYVYGTAADAGSLARLIRQLKAVVG